MAKTNRNHVCFDCRVSVRRPWCGGPDTSRKCPECEGPLWPLYHIGLNPPPKRDKRAWKAMKERFFARRMAINDGRIYRAGRAWTDSRPLLHLWKKRQQGRVVVRRRSMPGRGQKHKLLR